MYLFAMDTQLLYLDSVPAKNFKRIQILLDDASIKALKVAEKEQDRSRSWIVRDLISRHLKKQA